MNKKAVYGHLLSIISRLAGADGAKIFDALLRDHRLLNLKNPQTLADKLSYIELHAQSPLAPTCTDKYAVREYIAGKGLADILIPIYGGACTAFEEIDFDRLPDSFVIKATHGCKMNYPVPDKAKLDRQRCQREVRRWLNTTYGSYSVEPHYRSIPHRIYIEKYLGNAGDLIDYKFHCLNGEPQFVLVCSGRRSEDGGAMQVTLDLFDVNWQPIHELVATGREKPGDGMLERSPCFDEMLRISRRLSEDFRFVRVDLYALGGKIYFSELTFTPAHCVFPYFTERFNRKMGELLTLDAAQPPQEGKASDGS